MEEFDRVEDEKETMNRVCGSDNDTVKTNSTNNDYNTNNIPIKGYSLGSNNSIKGHTNIVGPLKILITKTIIRKKKNTYLILWLVLPILQENGVIWS